MEYVRKKRLKGDSVYRCIARECCMRRKVIGMSALYYNVSNEALCLKECVLTEPRFLSIFKLLFSHVFPPSYNRLRSINK